MADRPMSRGFNGTGMPPNTAMRGPPRTGMRTANLRTAQREPANYGGVGLNTTIKMENRPVTQQGLKGIRPGTTGPGRQVQDTSYYIGVIRQKCTELHSEVNKFKNEIDQFQADNNNYVKYERRYEELLKEVRDYEGTLADYNLARDKCRAGVDPEKVENYQRQLQQRNQQENREVDSIFLERGQREKAVHEIESQIMQLLQNAEDKINQLPTEQREEYQRLMKENQQTNRKTNEARKELEAITQQVHARERELDRENFREDCANLEKKMRKLQAEKENVMNELSMSKLDPDEARKRLLQKVKDDNAKIAELNSRIEDVDVENQNKRKQLAELDNELNDRQGDGGESQKYEVLFQRDQEMTEFIERFEGHKSQETAEQLKTKEMVVELLKHTSQTLDLEKNIDDLDGGFRGQQMDASKNTQGRLEQELTKKTEELEKINSLGSKISVELKSLKQKIEMMNSDMVAFENLDQLRDSAELAREHLTKLKKEYAKRRDAIKVQVANISSKYEKRKAQLNDNDTNKMLEGLQQKLRHHEQTIFHLQEFIEEKERETDFQSQKEVCGRIIDDLNAMLIEVATHQVLSAGGAAY